MPSKEILLATGIQEEHLLAARWALHVNHATAHKLFGQEATKGPDNLTRQAVKYLSLM